MAMDLKFLIGAEDQTGAATASASRNISGLNKSAADSGSVFDRVFSGGGGAVSGFVGKLSVVSAQFLAVKYAAETVFNGIVAAVTPGIEAIEKFTGRVVTMAAQITSFKGGDNIAQTYQEAKVYATALQETLEEIDAKTVASADDLGLITQEMIKQRVVLDTNNEKQLQAFANMANAVAVVAEGAGSKEIQIRQEVRALLQGQVNAQSVLAGQIDAMVGGGLKQKVELWKQEGTLVEHIGGLLQGYAAAQGDISATLGAMKSTTESITSSILRAGFKDIFKTMVDGLEDINKWAKENSEWIGNKIQQGWLAVRGLVESVWAVLNVFPLGEIWELTKMIAEGWGLILYAIFPPLLDRVAKFGQAIWRDVEVLGNLVTMLWKGLSFDFSGAFEAFQNAKANFAASGRMVGEAFAGGLGEEIARRANEFLALDALKGKTKTKATAPDLGKAPITEEERKVIGGAASALTKYADGIKEVGKVRLSLARDGFTQDLRRQADLLGEFGRVVGELRDPVNRYLALIGSVQEEQTKMENAVGSALDSLAGQKGAKDDKGRFQDDLEKAQKKHEVNLLQIQKDGAEERLKVWVSYYDSLKGVVEKKEKEIEDLQKKMMAARVKISEAIEANNKTLEAPGRELDAYEARIKAKADLLEELTRAANGGDLEANLKTLDGLIAKARELSTAVTMDGQDVISQVDAVNQSNEILRTIGEAQDKLHQDTISQAERDVQKLKSEMRSALDNIGEIRAEIEALDNRIATMHNEITLVAEDKVSPVLDRIQAQINALRSSSISINASGYTPVFPDLSESWNADTNVETYAAGTRYVSKTGLYQLHQGETVNNRLDVARSQAAPPVTIGDVSFVLPNVTNQSTAADLAREALPELMRLMRTRFRTV